MKELASTARDIVWGHVGITACGRAPWGAALLALILVTSCSNPQQKNRSVNSPTGAVFWEYEATAGIPNGPTRTFYPGGELQTEGFYLHGQKHGLHHAYAANGDVLKKALFWHDVIVWTTQSESERPPGELVLSLVGLTDPVEIRKRFGRAATVRDDAFMGIDLRSPIAMFSSTDRHVASGTRVGVHMGLGGGTAQLQSVRRYGVFGKVMLGANGVFVQVDGATVSNQSESTTGTIDGRRTVEAGGLREIPAGLGTFTARLSMAAPAGHDDVDGYVANATASFQRPADAVYSLPSTVAARSSMSWVLRRARWAVQTDVGLDVAAGGMPNSTPVFGRFNSALGLGVRSALVSLEVANTVQLNAPENNIRSLGVGVGIFSMGMAVKLLIATTTGGHATVSVGSEYAF